MHSRIRLQPSYTVMPKSQFRPSFLAENSCVALRHPRFGRLRLELQVSRANHGTPAHGCILEHSTGAEDAKGSIEHLEKGVCNDSFGGSSILQTLAYRSWHPVLASAAYDVFDREFLLPGGLSRFNGAKRAPRFVIT